MKKNNSVWLFLVMFIIIIAALSFKYKTKEAFNEQDYINFVTYDSLNQ